MHELVESIRRMQIDQWQAGKRIPVEVYLDQHPSLRDQEEFVLDLIYGEIVMRRSLGETIDLAEYCERFPTHAAQLRRQLEFDRLMEPSQATPEPSSQT